MGKTTFAMRTAVGFNPWYVGGGVKTADKTFYHNYLWFQSLVCWRGC